MVRVISRVLMYTIWFSRVREIRYVRTAVPMCPSFVRVIRHWMSTGFVHNHLPDGAFRCLWRAEVYALLPRKKRMYPENRTLRIGYRHLLWSRYARCFYERVIDEDTLDENLHYYISMRWVYLWPDEEMIDIIREEMNKDNLTYREIMWRRQNEWDYFDRHKARPTGNGDLFWEKYHREEYQKYLKKKT